MRNKALKFLLITSFVLSSSSIASAAIWDVVWTKTYDNTSHYDFVSDTAAYGDAVYVVGGQFYNKDLSLSGTGGYRIEKRSISSGNLVWSITGDPSGGLDFATAVVADSTYVYIGFEQGTNHNGAGGVWRIEKRNASNGSLVWTQTTDPTGYADYPVDMVLSGSNLYLLGVQNGGGGSAPDPSWRLERRSTSNGGLSWSQVYKQGTNGYPFALAISGTSLFTAGKNIVGGGQILGAWLRGGMKVVAHWCGLNIIIQHLSKIFVRASLRMVIMYIQSVKPLQDLPMSISVQSLAALLLVPGRAQGQIFSLAHAYSTQLLTYMPRISMVFKNATSHLWHQYQKVTPPFME